jgi:hypothetical protein
LISSKRVWTYSGQAPTSISPAYYTIPTNSVHDLNHTSGHMHYEELFPALRVQRIFDAIQTKYGITFSGNFLSNERFSKLFLWYKNKNEFNFYSEPQLVDFTSLSTSGNDALNTSHEIPELMFFKNAAVAKLEELENISFYLQTEQWINHKERCWDILH